MDNVYRIKVRKRTKILLLPKKITDNLTRADVKKTCQVNYSKFYDLVQR